MTGTEKSGGRSGRRITPTELVARYCGGYFVIPGTTILRAVRRPAERLSFAADVLRAVRAAESRLMAVMDDAAIELRDKHDAPWSAIGRRAGLHESVMAQRVSARRKLLAVPAASGQREDRAA